MLSNVQYILHGSNETSGKDDILVNNYFQPQDVCSDGKSEMAIYLRHDDYKFQYFLLYN